MKPLHIFRRLKEALSDGGGGTLAMLVCLGFAFGYNCFGKFITALVFLAIAWLLLHYRDREK